MRLQEKRRAIELRKMGMSYNEILKDISHVSKSTLSRWLANLSLTKKEKEKLQKKLKQKISIGLLKAAQTLRNNKIKRIKNIYCSAKKLFVKHHNDPFFISGLMLYWAEGAKTNQQVIFVNSDYRLIILMLKWLRKYVKVDEKQIRLRLYIHKIYAHEKHEQFWQKLIADVPKKQFLKTVYKPATHGFKRNPDYKGCMRVNAGGVKNFYTIKCWEEELTKIFYLSPSWCNG